MNSQPIGVFDSGLGGLSVVRHLLAQLPHEDIVYFGDTARVPYGSKSRRTVANFSLETSRYLLRYEPKLIVCACNTASALALDELRAELPVPIVGVVEPGAAAAARAARGSPIGVLGTEATINSGAYVSAIRSRASDAQVICMACPLLVPIVEEGRPADDLTVRLVVEGYLEPLRAAGARVVVLGCTHYPLLRSPISEYLGPQVAIIDSGQETARSVHEYLQESGGLLQSDRAGSLRCYVSDNPERFRRIGSRFLEHTIESVEFVEPESYITQPHLDGSGL